MSNHPPPGPYPPDQPASPHGVPHGIPYGAPYGAAPPYPVPYPEPSVGPPQPYTHPHPQGYPPAHPAAAPPPYPPAYAPPYGVAPPPVDPLPPPGTEYHQFLRTGRNRWWKGLVAIAAVVVAYLIVSLVLGLIAIGIEVATGRVSEQALTAGQVPITPLVLLSVNLTNAALIPMSMLLQWLLWGQPVRWLHSVRGYLRWDVLKRTALFVVPIFAAYVLMTFLFERPDPGAFTAESVGLLLVVLLTTPLQAAGEEYGTRGLIARAAGSWAADPRVALLVGTVLSATIFCVAHGAGDPWLIAYYFFFGVTMSIVVWRTGGLEVAVLIHTVNNLFLFVVAILAGQDLAAGLDRSEGSGGPWVLIPAAVLILITALTWWWARRQRVDRALPAIR